MKKRKMTVWMVLILLILAILPASGVDAASKDAAKKLSADKNLKKICRVAAAYTTAMDISADAPASTRTMKLDNADQLSIAAFVLFNETGDTGYTGAQLKRETKDLFGKSAVVNKKKIKKEGKTKMLVCLGGSKYVKDPYMYCGGEFGDGIPRYKIKKISRQGAGTCKVTLENRLGYYGEKGSDKVGTTTLVLKKKKSSSYGYIIKKISYKAELPW